MLSVSRVISYNYFVICASGSSDDSKGASSSRIGFLVPIILVPATTSMYPKISDVPRKLNPFIASCRNANSNIYVHTI